RLNVILRDCEIGMIQYVEELKPDSQRRVLPTGKSGVLHDREIRIEVTRPAKAVPALHESDSRTIGQTHREWAEFPGVKSGLAARLHKTRVRTGRRLIGQKLGWLARMHRIGERRSLAAGRVRSERSNRHRIDRPKVIVLS